MEYISMIKPYEMKWLIYSPRSVDGVTPTFKAASKGFKNITELLLKKKPNLGLQKVKPLHFVDSYRSCAIGMHDSQSEISDHAGGLSAECGPLN